MKPEEIINGATAGAEDLIANSPEVVQEGFAALQAFLVNAMGNPAVSLVVGIAIFLVVMKIVTKIGGTIIKAIIIAAIVAFLLSALPTISINLGLLGL